MAVDLQALLARVRGHLKYVPRNIQITWALDSELDNGHHWAQWRRYPHDGHWIGLSCALQRAPTYVLEYIIGHEVLHAIFPYRRCRHPKAHVVACYLLPHRAAAEKWLSRHS